MFIFCNTTEKAKFVTRTFTAKKYHAIPIMPNVLELKIAINLLFTSFCNGC